MAHWKKSFPSKYLQAADLDTPVIATVKTDRERERRPGRQRGAETRRAVAGTRERRRVESHARGSARGPRGLDDMDDWPGTRVLVRRARPGIRARRWRASSLPRRRRFPRHRAGSSTARGRRRHRPSISASRSKRHPTRRGSDMAERCIVHRRVCGRSDAVRTLGRPRRVWATPGRYSKAETLTRLLGDVRQRVHRVDAAAIITTRDGTLSRPRR